MINVAPGSWNLAATCLHFFLQIYASADFPNCFEFTFCWHPIPFRSVLLSSVDPTVLPSPAGDLNLLWFSLFGRSTSASPTTWFDRSSRLCATASPWQAHVNCLYSEG
ncbi:hypothetical protein B0H11DRAFT_2038623 [Mycena galericulata]|nr:hypothetical protein B0H11DRAFT_2038623 [Mycena galericulata]